MGLGSHNFGLGVMERFTRYVERKTFHLTKDESYNFRFSGPHKDGSSVLDLQLRSRTSQFVLQMVDDDVTIFEKPFKDDPDIMLRVAALELIGVDPLAYTLEREKSWDFHHLPRSLVEDAREMLEDHHYDVKHGEM